MTNDTLPKKYEGIVPESHKYFILKSRRKAPLNKIYKSIFKNLGYLLLISVFGYFFYRLLFGDYQFLENFMINAINGNNKLTDIFILLYFAFIFILWLFPFFGFLASILQFRSGGYFIATAIRLVHIHGREVRTIYWKRFEPDIKVIGDEKKGDIILTVKGALSRKRSIFHSIEHIRDELYLCGIKNPFEIEKLLEQKVTEMTIPVHRDSDPTIYIP